MKRADKSTAVKRNFFELVSGLSEVEILNLDKMRNVRGGDGEGAGGEPIIIIPPTNT